MQEFFLDKPLDDKTSDAFQRYGFAKRIAKIVEAPKIDKSLVVGLYGLWGEGKTTIMNFIKKELSNETVVINFNPWLFSDQESLLTSFLSAIAVGLNGSIKSAKNRIGNLLSDYADLLGVLDTISPIPIKDGAKAIGNKLKLQSIEDVKRKVDDLIIKSGKNIVIFVDDIDRLDVSEVQYLFKLTKLVADFPRTAYILAFDDRMVASALAPKYGGESSAGYAFLEKIIQIPLKIPKANKTDLRRYTTKHINEVLNSHNISISENEVNEFANRFDHSLLPFINNPRIGKRYASTLFFSLPLLDGEANVCDLMLLEGIKVFFPKVYDFIRNNGRLILYKETPVTKRNIEGLHKDDGYVKTILSQLVEEYGEYNERILDLLLFLFPQLESLYRNLSYSDDYYNQWYKEKRLCSYRYFERYFTYVVHTDDISDVYFMSIFSELETIDVNDLVVKLRKEVSKLNVEDLLVKLRYNSTSFNEIESKNLARALSKLGSSFSDDGRGFMVISVLQSVAYFISDLMKNIDENEVFQFCKELIGTAQPLAFAIRLDRAFNSIHSQKYSGMLLKKEESDEFQSIIVERFRDACNSDNFFDLLPEELIGMVMEWARDASRNEINGVVADLIKKNADNALRFIKVFISTVTSGVINGPTRTYKSNFTFDRYSAIANFLNVGMLYNTLLEGYGNLEELEVERGQNEPLSDKEIVALFQKYYIDDINGLILDEAQ